MRSTHTTPVPDVVPEFRSMLRHSVICNDPISLQKKIAIAYRGLRLITKLNVMLIFLNLAKGLRPTDTK